MRLVASLCITGALSWASTSSYAADLSSGDAYAFVAPATQTGWEFRVTPYAWAPSVNGDVTVRGQTADIDMSFWDLSQLRQFRRSTELPSCLDGVRGGPKRPVGHLWRCRLGQVRFLGDAVTQRNPIADLKVSARAKAGLGYEITMAESGVTYEVARWGGTRSSTALDLLGGARYWNQELDLSLAVDGSVDLGKLGLERSGSRAVRAIRHTRLGRSLRRISRQTRTRARKRASIPWRYRRFWSGQRFNVAVVCRLRFRLLAI